ncbi:ATP-NAD/AcoX kinase [gamma proteobacterium HdN1]|nr:ATP-NAD/AcoX kinase [gamma proteobacterium HdN1]
MKECVKMRLGLIVNPYAGIGGPAALKGSDGADTVALALERGVEPRAQERVRQTLEGLLPWREQIVIHTWAGLMGQAVAESLGFRVEVHGRARAEQSSAADTEAAAKALAAVPVDLLLFAGGDGTARNLVNAIGTSVPALGVPAGVKIHSGVYAVNPQGASEIVQRLLRGEGIALADTEVRDIDENAFREGRVVARHYGELRVPAEGRYLQNVKCGNTTPEPLQLADIAADVIERLEDDTLYIVGPGTTTRALMEELNQPFTLLGVDLLEGDTCIGNDLTEAQLFEQVQGRKFKIIVTAIGGQGHILGRGNQQISPRILREAGRENLWVIATRAKLEALEGRPLQLDTGDAALDRALSGYIRVVVGYQEYWLYPVGEPNV